MRSVRGRAALSCMSAMCIVYIPLSGRYLPFIGTVVGTVLLRYIQYENTYCKM